MNRNKFQIWLIAALAVLNVILAMFLFFKNPKHRGEDRPRNIIVEKLHFSKEQVAEYDKLIANHRMQIRSNQDQLNALKNKLYGQLVVENINPDSIFIKIAEVQRNIEKIHFDHFKDIKKLCTKDQMQAFDSLSKELAEIFSPPRPHKK